MFNLTNFVDPVQRFLDDSLFFDLSRTLQKKANFYVSNSKASLEDAFFQLG